MAWQDTDKSSNSQETLVEGQQVHLWQLVGVFILHMHVLSSNPTIEMQMLCEMHVIWYSPIEATKVKSQYRLVNT